MDYRWVMIITLWTFLSGPVFGPPLPAKTQHKARYVTKKTKPASKPARVLAQH